MIPIKVEEAEESKIAAQIPVCEFCGDEFASVRERDGHERFCMDNPWLEMNIETEQLIEEGEVTPDPDVEESG